MKDKPLQITLTKWLQFVPLTTAKHDVVQIFNLFPYIKPDNCDDVCDVVLYFTHIS